MLYAAHSQEGYSLQAHMAAVGVLYPKWPAGGHSIGIGVLDGLCQSSGDHVSAIKIWPCIRHAASLCEACQLLKPVF